MVISVSPSEDSLDSRLARLFLDADEFALALLLEPYDARRESKERIIRAATDIGSRLELCASLTDQYLAAVYELAAEAFNPQPLRVRVSPVSRAAYSFFVCHKPSCMSAVLTRR